MHRRPVHYGTYVLSLAVAERHHWPVPLNEQTGRRVVELTVPECWKLLASVPIGRVVFSQYALPAIRVVNHIVDDHEIIVRSHQGAAIVGHAAVDGGAVVCYEADDMDPARQTGWSVVVTGVARPVRDPEAWARYSRLLVSWAPGGMDHVIAIEPGIVTGRRLTA